jgi:hypothetical protein
MPIAERPLRGSTQVRAEVDSMSSKLSPGGPDARMASCLLQVVAGRVRLAGALSQAGMAAARATASKYSATDARKNLHVDDHAVLVLDQIHHAGHRDGVVVTDHHDCSEAITKGSRASDSRCLELLSRFCDWPTSRTP